MPLYAPLHCARSTKQVYPIVSGTILFFFFFFCSPLALILLSHSATSNGFVGLDKVWVGRILKATEAQTIHSHSLHEK